MIGFVVKADQVKQAVQDELAGAAGEFGAGKARGEIVWAEDDVAERARAGQCKGGRREGEHIGGAVNAEMNPLERAHFFSGNKADGHRVGALRQSQRGVGVPHRGANSLQVKRTAEGGAVEFDL